MILKVLFYILRISSHIFKKKIKKEGSCKRCKFNKDNLYCNVGSHYAEQGINALCMEGELWEEKEN